MQFFLLHELPTFNKVKSWEELNAASKTIFECEIHHRQGEVCWSDDQKAFIKYLDSERSFLFYNWVIHDDNLLQATLHKNFYKLPRRLTFYKKHALWNEFKSFLMPFIEEYIKGTIVDGLENETFFSLNEGLGYLVFLDSFEVDAMCQKIVVKLDKLDLSDWRSNNFLFLRKFITVWKHVGDCDYSVVTHVRKKFDAFEPFMTKSEVFLSYDLLACLFENGLWMQDLEKSKKSYYLRVTKEHRKQYKRTYFIYFSILFVLLVIWWLFF
jgi:hypothetical protein